MRGKDDAVEDAVRKVRTFLVIVILGGICACVAGIVTDDVVPIALGMIAVVSGVVLAVIAFRAQRKVAPGLDE
jgi:uncharacterized membrane protein HdeD (DUF308 family)